MCVCGHKLIGRGLKASACVFISQSIGRGLKASACVFISQSTDDGTKILFRSAPHPVCSSFHCSSLIGSFFVLSLLFNLGKGTHQFPTEATSYVVFSLSWYRKVPRGLERRGLGAGAEAHAHKPFPSFLPSLSSRRRDPQCILSMETSPPPPLPPPKTSSILLPVYWNCCWRWHCCRASYKKPQASTFPGLAPRHA